MPMLLRGSQTSRMPRRGAVDRYRPSQASHRQWLSRGPANSLRRGARRGLYHCAPAVQRNGCHREREIAKRVTADFKRDQAAVLHYALGFRVSVRVQAVEFCGQQRFARFNQTGAQLFGNTQGLVGAHLVTVGYGECAGQDARTQDIAGPLGTVVAGGVKQAMVAAHLVDMGHGESTAAAAKRWSHAVRDIETPLNTLTASGGSSAAAGQPDQCRQRADA